MAKPPDKNPNNYPSLKFDFTKNINYSSNGPVYLTMTRVSNNAETLANVSPFLIKKAIDNACNGEVDECKKTRSGDLIIKTKNSVQANRLIKLTAISNTITVNTTLHKTLNFAKGVIYCNDLRGLPDSEILEELKTQNVCEIRKIMKMINENLTETGLIILTFSEINTPLNINIGYQRISVRPYIPPPMRCKNCNRYNHTAKYCKSEKTCQNCATIYHLNDEQKETCVLPQKCINCISNDLTQSNHSARDKKCPIFIKETELQSIKTTYKVDNRTAKAIYNERHQHPVTTYSQVANQSNSNLKTQSTTYTTTPNNNRSATTTTTLKSTPSGSSNNASNDRNLINYDDLIEDTSNDPQPNKIDKKKEKKEKVTILPRNTSKRLRSEIAKSTITANTNISTSASVDSPVGDPMDTTDNITHA